MLPIGGPSQGFLGVGADKWMHIALFFGLAALIRWNWYSRRYGILASLVLACLVAVLTEAAQSLVAYRSADMWDLVAGFLGASLGAVCMNPIVSSPVPERWAGLFVVVLGSMVSGLFILADMIGVGTSSLFGTTQILGTVLGSLLILGGVMIYARGSRFASHMLRRRGV